MNLEGIKVCHKTYGVGVVSKHEGKYLTISFLIGDKLFSFPKAFENFLTAADDEIAIAINIELEKERKLEEINAHPNEQMKNKKKEKEPMNLYFNKGTPKKQCSKKLNKFTIEKNQYLMKDIIGYYHQYYTGFRKPGNPDFINILKNTFDDECSDKLVNASNKVANILKEDIPYIIQELNRSRTKYLLVCVPRAKNEQTYSKNQLLFREAVRKAANVIKGVDDGTRCIIRHKNTFTTHLKWARGIYNYDNSGEKPYPGITMDTCKIDYKVIRNRSIILIDDVYTKNTNVDEDCIQTLFDKGAREIIFYSIAYTRRK